MIFLREISSPDQGSADARRFDNETSFAQLDARLGGGCGAWSQLSGKEAKSCLAMHPLFTPYSIASKHLL